LGFDARSDGTRDKPLGVIEKYLVIPSLHTGGRQSDEISVERRSQWITGVVAVQVTLDQALDLVPEKIGVGLSTGLPARSG
jgi:hypothetical protein